jgi:hypothetical protein
VVLLRKRFPQKPNLQTAAVLSVKCHMNSNLKIENKLLEYMDEALLACKGEEFVLSITNGETNSRPPPKWSMSIMPADFALSLISSGVAQFVQIQNRKILVYPIDLISELENKVLCFGLKEIELIPSV